MQKKYHLSVKIKKTKVSSYNKSVKFQNNRDISVIQCNVIETGILLNIKKWK